MSVNDDIVRQPNNHDKVNRTRRLLSTAPENLVQEDRVAQKEMIDGLASVCVDFTIDARKKGYRNEQDLKAYIEGNLELAPDGTRLLKFIPDIPCPQCGESIRAPLTAERPKAATCYDECLRKCATCNAGWSNARNTPVACIDKPTRAVPLQVRTHLNKVLDGALNLTNRANKKRKFCFETSEDAVTWTLFEGLRSEKRLASVIQRLLPDLAIPDDAKPSLLLWGCHVPPDTRQGEALQARLIAASDQFKESPRARTEPDVIIDFGDYGLVFIEVKLHSGNEIKDDGQRFRRYTQPGIFANPDDVIRSGYYELARNWAIGTAMAGRRPFVLVNLAKDVIFGAEDQQGRWQTFFKGLGEQPGRDFRQMGWSEVLNKIEIGWIVDFVKKRLNW